MMDNIIDFPIKGIFDRETFDSSQSMAKKLCKDAILNSDSIEGYVLTMAMASGHAISYLKDHHPDLYNHYGYAVELTSHGVGLKYRN